MAEIGFSGLEQAISWRKSRERMEIIWITQFQYIQIHYVLKLILQHMVEMTQLTKIEAIATNGIIPKGFLSICWQANY